MRDNNPTLEIENKDFENNTSEMPKITQSYMSKYLCGQLAKKIWKLWKIIIQHLKLRNFEQVSSAMPKITKRYVNKSLWCK